MRPPSAFARACLSTALLRGMVSGDELRDWMQTATEAALFPYDDNFEPIDLATDPAAWKTMWAFRTCLANNMMFGKQTKVEAGLKWWEYGRLTSHKLRAPLSITFGEIATHNHFVLDRGGKVFKQTAPVIKLPAGSSEDDHLGLLGVLNSSVACFWLQQVCHNKGRPGAEVAGADERYEMRYAINASNVAELPICADRPLAVATRIHRLAQQLTAALPAALLAADSRPDRSTLDDAQHRAASLRRQMFAAQEELDWQCYRLYCLVPTNSDAADFETAAPPEIALGERAFEIVLARKMAAGSETSTWFERHGSTPITEIPSHWPEEYRRVVQRRVDLIGSDRKIALIERPECKRRWNSHAWESLEQAALRDWLLDRLESPRYWPRQDATTADQPPELGSTSRLADAARQDADFMRIAALYAGHADFDPGQLVTELVASEAVPFLPVQRYTETGMRKRAQWQNTGALQRREDQIDAQVDDNADDWRQELAAQARETYGSDSSEAAIAWIDKALTEEITRHKAERKEIEVGKIPVPPKYQNKDFIKSDFWRLRGGLDVPKERWISYPGCERGADGSLVIAWAGWTHLQQATALAGAYLDRKEKEGWPPERLAPLLAGLLELLPG